MEAAVELNLPSHLVKYQADFMAAASATGMDPAHLAAICDRESRGGLALTPPGPAGTGDNGHGRGLMQVDDRTWKEFCADLSKWGNPRENILCGARILAEYIGHFRRKGYPDAEFYGTSAYNCGVRNVEQALAKVPPGADHSARRLASDSRTTQHNYAADVFRRRASFSRVEVSTATPSPELREFVAIKPPEGDA